MKIVCFSLLVSFASAHTVPFLGFCFQVLGSGQSMSPRTPAAHLDDESVAFHWCPVQLLDRPNSLYVADGRNSRLQLGRR